MWIKEFIILECHAKQFCGVLHFILQYPMHGTQIHKYPKSGNFTKNLRVSSGTTRRCYEKKNINLQISNIFFCLIFILSFSLSTFFFFFDKVIYIIFLGVKALMLLGTVEKDWKEAGSHFWVLWGGWIQESRVMNCLQNLPRSPSSLSSIFFVWILIHSFRFYLKNF